MAELGRLIRQDRIRETWPDEARDFTPWLAGTENLALLSETLGFGPEGFEFEAMEVNSGAFRADILCRDTTSSEGERVLIENQFGKSDHDHLGKLITYASGLGAKTVILIGEEIRDEHRAALDWLNSISNADIRFFALAIELWRIGDSEPAPRFNVIVKPNDWTKVVSRTAKVIRDDLSPHRQMLLRYWTAFEELLARTNSPVRAVSPQPQNWLVHSIGKAGVSINTSINSQKNCVRAEIYLTGPNAKSYFGFLEMDREEIEKTLDPQPIWQNSAEKDSRIHVSLEIDDMSDEAGWPSQHQWLIEQVSKLHTAFHEPVRRLDKEIAGLI